MHPSLSTALALASSGRLDEARDLLQRQLRSRPRDPDLHHHLAHLLLASGNLDRAAFHYEQAAALAPDTPDYLVGHAVALGRQGRAADAAKIYRRAADLDPSHFDAHLGLSHVLAALNRFEEAAAAAQRAADLNPDHAHAWINLAVCLTRVGRGRESVAHLRRALERIPDHPLLLTQYAAELNYISGIPRDEIFRAHQSLGRVLERDQGGDQSVPPANPDPERPLRIAYLSPDFRSHSVASFVEPILRAHDRARFHTTCISCTTMRDGTTRRLATLPDEWIDATGLTDDALAARVRAAAPDILVDLAGHTSESPVRVMARRLAPIQITAIGYPNTTGIPAIDARLADSITDPPGAEPFATERLIRLDPCFLTYLPPPPNIQPLISFIHYPIRFASFNIISKVSDACLDAWCELLRSLPDSVLRLKSGCFDEHGPRADWSSRFQSRGVAPARVELLGHIPTFEGHLAAYAGVSIALDTFPYNGTTTTCEALWMGVPVVTFTGDAHAGRVSASLLTSAGLPDLVAPDVQGYIALARALAADPARFPGLRQRLARSPLCDAAAYTRRLERACRDLWRERCSAPPPA